MIIVGSFYNNKNDTFKTSNNKSIDILITRSNIVWALF